MREIRMEFIHSKVSKGFQARSGVAGAACRDAGEIQAPKIDHE